MRRAVGLAILVAAVAPPPPPARRRATSCSAAGAGARAMPARARPASAAPTSPSRTASAPPPSIPAGVALIPRAELSAEHARTCGRGSGSLGRTVTPAEPAGPSPRRPAAPCRRARPSRAGPPSPARRRGRRGRSRSRSSARRRATAQENQVDVVRGPGPLGIGHAFLVQRRRSASPWRAASALAEPRGDRGLAPRPPGGPERGPEPRRGRALARHRSAGTSNKARGIAGLLATFGPSSDPTAFRLGARLPPGPRRLVGRAHRHRPGRGRRHRPRTSTSRSPPSWPRARPGAPPTPGSSRASWTTSGTSACARSLERNTDAATAEPFRLDNRLEPRLGIEMTRPSPTGRLLQAAGGHPPRDGGAPRLRGHRRRPAPGLRGDRGSAVPRGAGASLLGEFYENGVPLRHRHQPGRRRAPDVGAGRRTPAGLLRHHGEDVMARAQRIGWPAAAALGRAGHRSFPPAARPRPRPPAPWPTPARSRVGRAK